MWIRSQSKMILVDCHKFVVIGEAVKGVDAYGNYITLGDYKDKDAALNVLNVIHEYVENGRTIYVMPGTFEV